MSLYVKYLVCYDISNTRTRSKFFDFLKDLGLTPIQKSVFFGDLKTPEVRSLKAAAEKWLDASCDSCLYFPCHLKVEDIRKCFGLKHFTYENSYLRERWSQTREHPRFLFT